MTLPKHEMDLLSGDIAAAVVLATQGHLVAGYRLLVDGWDRANSLTDPDEPWTEELVVQYREAIDGYCSAFGVPLE